MCTGCRCTHIHSTLWVAGCILRHVQLRVIDSEMKPIHFQKKNESCPRQETPYFHIIIYAQDFSFSCVHHGRGVLGIVDSEWICDKLPDDGVCVRVCVTPFLCGIIAVYVCVYLYI